MCPALSWTSEVSALAILDPLLAVNFKKKLWDVRNLLSTFVFDDKQLVDKQLALDHPLVDKQLALDGPITSYFLL